MFEKLLNISRKQKGLELSIRTIAMIALGMMVVVLVFVSFESWFTELVDGFLSQVDYGASIQ